MALIEEYHVVADMYPVSATSNPGIIEGRVVALEVATGNAVLCSTTLTPIGLAGDSSETSGGHTHMQADLVISPTGKTRSTSVRVSDFFDETAASGKVTVYNGGGKFHTDQFVAGVDFDHGAAVYSNATGSLTTAVATGGKVGTVVVPPRNYPSGVPGTEIDGHMSLGSFMTIVLSV